MTCLFTESKRAPYDIVDREAQLSEYSQLYADRGSTTWDQRLRSVTGTAVGVQSALGVNHLHEYSRHQSQMQEYSQL